ncbi:MAG: hypothetical protein Q8Q35_00390 [Nanoarchaeota archaeon]|nr:hypothetical protein [Nanoarchaeota archaeon]
MKKQLFTNSYVKIGIIILAIVILLAVLLIRGSQPGTEAYLNMRLAENPALYDDLSFSGRVAAYEWGTPLVLSLAPHFLAYALPILLGILSIFVFERILKKIIGSEIVRNISLILFVISPTFIYTFSSANNFFIPFFLSLITFSLFINEKRKMLTIPLLLILPLFSIVITTGLLLVMFCYTFFENKNRTRLFLLLLIIGLIVSLGYFGFFIYKTGVIGQTIIEDSSNFTLFKDFIYDLGMPFGIGMFIFIMGILGIMNKWEEKYSKLFIFFSIAILGIFSFFRSESLLLLNLFVIVFASIGFVDLLDRRWSSSKFRDFVLLIVILGFLFSGVSQITSLINSQPDKGMINAMNYLSNQDQGVVFSDYSRGVWINYAGHKNVLDENYLFIEDAEERFDDMNALFYYRELNNSTAILDKYNINYIWIDENYKEDVWEYDTEGLLFISEYTSNFYKIYDKEGVVIWEIQR